MYLEEKLKCSGGVCASSYHLKSHCYIYKNVLFKSNGNYKYEIFSKTKR